MHKKTLGDGNLPNSLKHLDKPPLFGTHPPPPPHVPAPSGRTCPISALAPHRLVAAPPIPPSPPHVLPSGLPLLPWGTPTTTPTLPMGLCHWIHRPYQPSQTPTSTQPVLPPSYLSRLPPCSTRIRNSSPSQVLPSARSTSLRYQEAHLGPHFYYYNALW